MVYTRGANTSVISALETEIGCDFPESYRSFLLNEFDENREHTCFRATATGEEVWEISNFFRLGTENKFADLARNWDPTKLYDLESEKERLSHFIVIADDEGGSKVLLHLISGEVWLLAHDCEVQDASTWIGEAMSLFKVQGNFDLFLKSLCSPDEMEDETFSSDWFAEAELRRMSVVRDFGTNGGRN